MYILEVMHRKSMKHEIEIQRIEFQNLFYAIDRAVEEQQKLKNGFYMMIIAREDDSSLNASGKTFYYASNCVGA